MVSKESKTMTNQVNHAQQEILEKTRHSQAVAATPTSSAFVSANAGTGKTYILVNRVLRLLLAGSEPFRILCLTYTNAAAAEMENRLFEELSKWVTMPSEQLEKTLKNLLGQTPSQEQTETARRLFAKSIETPGGMKVQTIHSFCEKLLQRFPLEADVPPHFNVLDEPSARELLNNAISKVLSAALKHPKSEEAKALKTVISHAGDMQFESLVDAALRQRSTLGPLMGPDPDALLETLQKTLDLPTNQDLSFWQAAMAGAIPINSTKGMIEALLPLLIEEGGTTNEALAAHLTTIKNANSDQERITALKSAFLTSTNEKRKRLVTKAISEAEPALCDRLAKAQEDFYNAFLSFESLQVASATKALLELADKIIQLYEQQKISRAALDYQDLIERTAYLLTTRSDTAWVLYKLDQGIDHILVDEAQDTSPDQWKIISQLAQEFFSGQGASQGERTLFAVGDEKQSIYGFQGADPRQFNDMGTRFKTSATEAKKTFNTIPLNLSFRSTGAILQAVDHVFKDPALSQCLTSSSSPIAHFSNRAQEPGLVEIWPTQTTQKQDKAPPFAPLDDQSVNTAPERTAQQIAKKIKSWLDTREILASRSRPIEAGDILILVRKRAPFAPMMIRALKAHNIPVAGADRIVITQQLAVMDMMALGQFLSLPEDDLSLASLLKSPIFNLDDDDLFTLSHKRKGSLWQSLRYFAKQEEKFQHIASQLSTWLSRADILPPFEFFAHLLEAEGLRKKFIARLGAVAGDALDEFLNLSLHYDDQEPPSLEGFLSWLNRSGAEVKRDMEKGVNEVRIMTVHGAKGLEADIVFLPDTCSTGSASQSDSLLAIKQPNHPSLGPEQKALVWSLPNKGHLSALSKGREAIKQAEQAEQLRLLYVAMTRARDRLYITGFETAKGRGKNCWYDLITQGLDGHTKEINNSQGVLVQQLITGTQNQPPRKFSQTAAQDKTPPLPKWATTPTITEPTRTIPVAPSSIMPYETPEDDEDKLPQEPALMSPKTLGSDGRFIRGRLVHKLLEYLPDLAPTERQKAALALASSYGRDLSMKAQAAIIDETMAILENSEFTDLFAPGSQAEVNIIAKVNPKGSDKPPILLQGQIDRLVVRDKEIVIVDYKSNRPSPRKLEDVAPAYQAQLAAYRLAMREIYPHHSLKAALLWTDGPYFMEIPAKMMDEYETLLHRS